MIYYGSPILTSLLDTDAYKFYMQQAVLHRYPTISVVAEFQCRGNECLGEYANAIRAQVDQMSHLSLTDAEFTYLSGLPFFRKDYLCWLRDFRYRPNQVKIENRTGKLRIRIAGPWCEVIMWEVPLLAVISEVVHLHQSPEVNSERAVTHLLNKLLQFKTLTGDIDISRFNLVDFGTRRRFSQGVQQAIISTMKTECPYLIGTSNYNLAHLWDLAPIGTQAHEWFQAHQQISPVLANSQRIALQAWLDEYPDHLSIALTDCITMDAFLRDFDSKFAHCYRGLRHDSGDPFAWGVKAISHYRKLGIDPMSKTLVFSDNLDLDKALALYCYFCKSINLIFGIGTRLTCDILGVKPLNIVIKLIECQGKPVAKLSDNPEKTICRDQAFAKALRKAFNLCY